MTDTKTPENETLENYRRSFEAFEKTELCGEGGWLCPERRSAFQRFEQNGFPGSKDEEWRYTRLESVKKMVPKSAATASVDLKTMEPYVLDPAWPRAVFVDGVYQPALSAGLEDQKGLRVMSLAEALRRHEPQLASGLREARLKPRALTDLNTAFFTDGIEIQLAAGTHLEKPLQVLSLFLFAEGERAIHPRNLILAGPGSRAAIIQSFAGIGSNSYFSNGLTEVRLSEKARLDHYVLQQGGSQGFQTARGEIWLEKESRYETFMVSADTPFFRYEIDAVLAGRQAGLQLHGFYLTAGNEHVDQNVLIEHRVPECTSGQVMKGILDGHSRLVVRGKVHVYPDAQKTDAQQTMKNLLLSRDATADAQPQLEIYADDVKCTHGTAIGQLEDDAIFYLKSRGIEADEARRILTRGFAMEVLEKIPLEPVRRAAEAALGAHFREV